MLFKIDFRSEFGRSWEPKGNQVGTKFGSNIDVNFGSRFLKKTLFFLWKNKMFGDPWAEVGKKILSKINKEWKPTWNAS